MSQNTYPVENPVRVAAIEQQLSDPRNRFLRWRQLADGTYVATRDLIYTRAICTDCHESGFSGRYCFFDPELADSEFDRLVDGDSEPAGWIAQR